MEMIKIDRKLFLVLILILILSILSNAILVYQNYTRNVVGKVVDGDSLDLTDGRRIRLLGIDAPEKGNCQSDTAQQLLQGNALRKHVRLKNIVKDSYGRILANVIVEDFSTWISYLRWRFWGKKGSIFPSPDPYLNRLVVSQGLAWNTNSNAPEYKEQIKMAESYAKEKRLGLWSDRCIQLEPASSECTIKGNIRNDIKTYYLPECRYYRQVIVNTAYGDRWFCNEEETIEAGFRKTDEC